MNFTFLILNLTERERGNMPIEKSAGAIIFRLQPTRHPPARRAPEDGKIYYLLLNYPSTTRGAKKDYWDFPKGHIEKGEKELETVKREVEEETGLKNLKLIEGFKEWIKYFFKYKGKTIFKIVTFYLAETKTKEVEVSLEHLGYEWLPYEEAIKQLTFRNARDILRKANDFLKLKKQNAK